MISTVALRLAEAWLACAAIQLVLWAISLRTRNAGIVDVGWALSFIPVVGLFGASSRSSQAAWLPIALTVIAWSARLGGYLLWRGAATGPEEGRYVELRRRWADAATRRFLVFFQAQGAMVALLSLAFVVPFVAPPWDGGLVRTLGVAIALVGLVGETVADAQLARFRREPTNRGKVCEVGLWRYSRHPNYFFEWCVWIGYAVYGLAFGVWGLIALVPQAIILGSIRGVTGIPPTEHQAIRSKGDAYRAYQARVSRFIPMPPKRTPPNA